MHEIADLRIICIWMNDQGHALFDRCRDIFENMRLGIGEESKSVSPDAGVFAGHILSEPVRPEDIIFSPRDIGGGNAWFYNRKPRFHGIIVDPEDLALGFVRLTYNQRPADLHVV